MTVDDRPTQDRGYQGQPTTGTTVPGIPIQGRIDYSDIGALDLSGLVQEERRGGASPYVGGMPADYRVERTYRDPSSGYKETYTVRREPRYEKGEEGHPANEGFDAIVQRQQSLVMAGYLDVTDDFRWGAWDETTRDAYRDLLEDANWAGISAQQQLHRAASAVGTQEVPEGSGPGHWEPDPETGEMRWVEDPFVPPPLDLRTTHPADLRRVFRRAVIETLGEGWDEARINELVDAYNWEEIRLQVDAYTQETDRLRQEWMGEEPETEMIHEVIAPSPEAFVEEELRERDPEGVQAGRIATEFAPAFFESLGGYV